MPSLQHERQAKAAPATRLGRLKEPSAKHVPGELGVDSHKRAIPTTGRGLRARYVKAWNHSKNAKFIGWTALEQSWLEDMEVIAKRMHMLGVEIPVLRSGW
jgi:hypothetical protein